MFSLSEAYPGKEVIAPHDTPNSCPFGKSHSFEQWEPSATHNTLPFS